MVFTIIEALLAALLLSAGLVVLFSIVNRSVFIHGEIASSEIAAVLADETLNRIGAGLVNISDETTSLSGDFSSEYPKYSWKAFLEPTGVISVKVNVAVAWEFNGRSKSYAISTFFYKGGSKN